MNREQIETYRTMLLSLVEASCGEPDELNQLCDLALSSLGIQGREPVAWLCTDSARKSRPIRHPSEVSDDDIQEYELTFAPLYALSALDAPPAPAQDGEKS